MKNRKAFLLASSAVGAVSLLFVVSVARAQTASEAAPTPTQDTSLTIGEVVVTAERAPELTHVLTSVDVLDGSIAQHEQVNNAFELFQRLPGVLTTNFNQGTTNGSISMRGFNGEGGINAVKLLIDGVPSNDYAGFTPFLDEIFPLDISRIEVVRGTSDARYGLDNIAGNANIVTRTGGNYVDGQTTVGSFQTYDTEASVGQEAGDFSQNYFAASRHSDGERDHESADRWTLGGKWFDQLGSYKVGVIARYYQAEAQEPGYLLLSDAENNPNLSYPSSATDGDLRKLAQVSLHADGDITDQLTTSSILYYNHVNDQRFVTFLDYHQLERETQENQYGGIGAIKYRPDVSAIMHSLTLEGGIDFHIEDNGFQQYHTDARVRVNQELGQSFTLNNYGGYVQAVIEPTSWLKIVPADRMDNFSGRFNNTLTGGQYPIIHYGVIQQPKVSVQATLSDELLVYGNYGRTFQIALGTAAAYLVPPQTTNISPSINDGLETGIKYKIGDWFEGRAAVWQQTASDEIEYNEFTLQQANIGKTRRRGYDIQFNVRPTSQLGGWVSFSEQRGVILIADPANPGERVGNVIDHVPQYLISGGVDFHPTDKLRLALLGNGQTKFQLDTSNSHGQFGNYAIFNVEAGYQIIPHIEIELQVRNLSNDRYFYAWWDGSQAEISPADGRTVYGGVRLKY